MSVEYATIDCALRDASALRETIIRRSRARPSCMLPRAIPIDCALSPSASAGAGYLLYPASNGGLNRAPARSAPQACFHETAIEPPSVDPTTPGLPDAVPRKSCSTATFTCASRRRSRRGLRRRPSPCTRQRLHGPEHSCSRLPTRLWRRVKLRAWSSWSAVVASSSWSPKYRLTNEHSATGSAIGWHGDDAASAPQAARPAIAAPAGRGEHGERVDNATWNVTRQAYGGASCCRAHLRVLGATLQRAVRSWQFAGTGALAVCGEPLSLMPDDTADRCYHHLHPTAAGASRRAARESASTQDR